MFEEIFGDMELNPLGIIFGLGSGFLMWILVNYWNMKGMHIGLPMHIVMTLMMPFIAYFIIVSMSNK